MNSGATQKGIACLSTIKAAFGLLNRKRKTCHFTIVLLIVQIVIMAGCRGEQERGLFFATAIAMSDGCKLAADVYLPGPGRHPVVLYMTPYGRKQERQFAESLSNRGYAAVIQDVRGRYDSEGVFEPIFQERSDGPQTVDWIVKQDWYDPERGMAVVGSCYVATVGLATAAQRSQVRAMVSIGGLKSLYNLCYRSGARVIHHALPWAIITSASPQPGLAGIDWNRVFATEPIGRAAQAAGFDVPLWETWTQHPNETDDYWTGLGVEEYFARIDIPILHISGWYDIDLGSALDLYGFFIKHASSPQALVIGPWSHATVWQGGSTLHGVEFGPDAESDLIEQAVNWLDRFLAPEPQSDERQSFVRVFVTGANRWIELPAWPAGQRLEFYLDQERLITQAPLSNDSRCFIYDPTDPVPTLGGNLWVFTRPHLVPGPADQSSLHARTDVLVFSTPPLPKPLVVAGPVEVEVWVTSDAETTDFTAKLVDLSPEGIARYLADGIVRTVINKGQVMQLTIDLWSTAHRFGLGHRVGLEVSSSCFPKFDLNINTVAGPPRSARQCVHFGSKHPSRLLLSLVERDASDVPEEGIWKKGAIQ